MSSLSSWLPQSEGILPYYLLVLSLISVGNSVQNLLTLHYSRRLYNGKYVPNTKLPPRTEKFNPEDAVNKYVSVPLDSPKGQDQATPLATRCFGTWTFLTSIVRLYAAYHLNHAHMYDLAIWTYVVALLHFVSELLYFKSMTLGVPQLFPLTLASIALCWMPLVRDFYVTSP